MFKRYIYDVHLGEREVSTPENSLRIKNLKLSLLRQGRQLEKCSQERIKPISLEVGEKCIYKFIRSCLRLKDKTRYGMNGQI